MSQLLLDAVRRYADANVDGDGVARTPVPGLSAIRATRPSELQFAINRPLVALVVQGRKRVSLGSETFDFGAGESLLIAADVPTVSQITRASLGAPYYSLVLELDPATIEALAMEMHVVQAGVGGPVRVDPTEAEVAEAAARLVNLLDRPMALPLLQDQFVRELHFWLLAGRHGAAIRALGIANSHAQRIGRAVALIREDYAQPLRIEKLAEAAGMSPSSFHQHFRGITSLSPLQFQKQLRLIEARRMMVSEGLPASNAAYAVGYESVPQFTREYGRLFGVPPVRDMKQARSRMTVAA
ncbi:MULTISPECIES: AraC family transcriptional regulator [unclassified Sphingomonas]|nr:MULTISPECIES: AraC family transcriptional regulator [unclassified Sphingomonas]KQX20386.1 AraC family transcriptional regulator [Sphingomonas sp. Root1294]KQY67635.1 AraC family transcriptional regulator [Sphingomonas sp. Root50]KRB91371.1 AraC family transcriptional regulator [Sphingomonas sp. Root720]